jgi:hypothetical protein
MTSTLDKLGYLNYNLRSYLKRDSSDRKIIEDKMITLMTSSSYKISTIEELERIPPPIVSFYFNKAIDELRIDTTLSPIPIEITASESTPSAPIAVSQSIVESGPQRRLSTASIQPTTVQSVHPPVSKPMTTADFMNNLAQQYSSRGGYYKKYLKYKNKYMQLKKSMQ